MVEIDDIFEISKKHIFEELDYLINKNFPKKPVKSEKIAGISIKVFKEISKTLDEFLKHKKITPNEFHQLKDESFQKIHGKSEFLDKTRIDKLNKIQAKVDTDVNLKKQIKNIEKLKKIESVEEQIKNRKVITKKNKILKRTNQLMKWFGKSGLKTVPFIGTAYALLEPKPLASGELSPELIKEQKLQNFQNTVLNKPKTNKKKPYAVGGKVYSNSIRKPKLI